MVFDQGPVDPSVASDDPRRPVTALGNTRTPGLAGARNSGIAAGRAPWVAFCDDDDRWLPDKLTAQLGRAGAHRRSHVGDRDRRGPTASTRTTRVATRAELTLANLVRHRVMAAHPSTVVVAREALEGADRPGRRGDPGQPRGGLRLDHPGGPARRLRRGRAALVEVTLGTVPVLPAVGHHRGRHRLLAGQAPGVPRRPARPGPAAAGSGRSRWPRCAARRSGRRSGRRSAAGRAERRTALALAVALRLVSAERLMDLAHRHGRGI